MKTEIDIFIDNYPSYDFSDEELIHKHIGRFLFTLNQNADSILKNDLSEKSQNDFQQLKRNNDLQSLALYNYIIRRIFYRVETDYIEKKKLSDYLSILHRMIFKSITKLSAIITLYCSENYADCYSIDRNIYEHFILFSYILKNEDVSKAFVDHAFMSYYLLLQINDKADDIAKEKLAQYIKDYGETFKHEYGWANKKLNKQNKVLLTDLINGCENKDLIDSFKFSYNYACKFVHASSYASFTDNDDIAYISTLIRNIIEMIQYELCTFFNCLKMVTKDKVLLNKLVNEFSKLSIECIKHFEKKMAKS